MKAGVKLLLGTVVVGGVITVAAMYNAGQKIKDLTYSFKKFPVISRKGTKIEMTIDLGIENPNPKAVKFESFIADAFHGNTKVGSVNVVPSQLVMLAPRDTTILKGIKIKLDKPLITGVEIITALAGKKQYVLVLKGKVKADGFSLPVNEDMPVAKGATS